MGTDAGTWGLELWVQRFWYMGARVTGTDADTWEVGLWVQMLVHGG